MTYSEAAKQLGVPRGTIMSRLSRGRAAVLRELASPAEAPLTLGGGED